MANVNCQACEDLREVAPSLACGGFTDDMCTSLQNDTGLTASSGNNDCTDLDNMNDCLIGNEDANVELFEVCDWKKFMHEFIPNLWTMLKAIICAICGIWTNIHNLWTKVNKHDCILDHITTAQSFAVTEDYIRYAPGVSKNPDASSDPALSIPRISGNAYCAYITGSLLLSQTYIDNHDNSTLNDVGALLYEYRIKLSDFNLKRVWPGNLQEGANGKGVHAHIFVFSAGQTTYGNDGRTGTGSTTVPSGYVYLQIRLSSYDSLGNGKITPVGNLPVLMNPSEFVC